MSEQPPTYGTPMPPPPAGELGPNFSATEAIGYGWRGFRTNWTSFLAMTLLLIVVSSIFQSIGESSGGTGGTLIQIVGNVVALLFAAALTKGALDAVDGRPVSLGAMFDGWDKVQVVIAAILVAIGTAVGLYMVVIPGLIWMFLTSFTNYFIIDGQDTGVGSIGKSLKFTSGNVGDLLILMLVSIGVIILGALALLVGLLVAIPIVCIAAAYAFRVLHGRPVAIQS